MSVTNGMGYDSRSDFFNNSLYYTLLGVDAKNRQEGLDAHLFITGKRSKKPSKKWMVYPISGPTGGSAVFSVTSPWNNFWNSRKYNKLMERAFKVEVKERGGKGTFSGFNERVIFEYGASALLG